MLTNVLETLVTVLGIDGAVIRLRDPATGRWTLRVDHGVSEMPVDEDWPGRPLTHTTVEEDLATAVGANGDHLKTAGFRSVARLPLRTPAGVIGLLTLASREGGRLNHRQEAIFSAVAHQVAVAVDTLQHSASGRRSSAGARSRME